MNVRSYALELLDVKNTWKLLLLIGNTCCKTSHTLAAGFADDCGWCSELPARLKALHSHWLSRKRGVVLLRGTRFSDRRVHFVMRLGARNASGGPAATLYEVPDRVTNDIKVCSLLRMSVKKATGCAACATEQWHYVLSGRPEMYVHNGATLQGMPWPKLLHRIDRLHEIGHLSSPDCCAPLTVLSAFEDTAFIHISVQPVTGQRGERCMRLRFELVRHRLTFELRKGKLESVERRGWHVRCAADAADAASGAIALPAGLSTFLALYPDSPSADVQLLVLAGAISTSAQRDAVNIARSDAPDAQLGHHVYSVHPRTGHLAAFTVCGRLHLAALYAACGSALPMPGVRITGGEMARELLEQSEVNRPLNGDEAAALRTLARFAVHQSDVALLPLCKAYAEQSESVRFLYPGVLEAPLSIEMPAHEMALFERALQRTPAPFQHARRALTPLQTRLLLGREPSRRLGLLAAPPELVDWLRAPDCVSHAGVRALQQRAADIGALLHADKPATPLAAGDAVDKLDLASCQRSPLGQEFVSELHASIETAAGQARTNVSESRASAVCAQLCKLAKDAVKAANALEDELITSLAMAPAGKGEQVLAALRASTLVATPTTADLVMLKVQPGLLQVRYRHSLSLYLGQRGVLCSAANWRTLQKACILSQRCHPNLSDLSHELCPNASFCRC